MHTDKCNQPLTLIIRSEISALGGRARIHSSSVCSHLSLMWLRSGSYPCLFHCGLSYQITTAFARRAFAFIGIGKRYSGTVFLIAMNTLRTHTRTHTSTKIQEMERQDSADTYGRQTDAVQQLKGTFNLLTKVHKCLMN